MKPGSSRGMDTRRQHKSEQSKRRRNLRLTNRSTKPYPWPPKQAQPDVSKPGRSTKAMQKKEVKVLETGDNATLRWFTEAVKIFGLVLAGTVQNNQSQILEAKGRAD